MKKTFVMAAATAMLATTISANAGTDAPAMPSAKDMKAKEKCYGVAKAGKNDCSWSGGSCAGSATKDAEKGAWMLLPKGACDKIVGGSTKAS